MTLPAAGCNDTAHRYTSTACLHGRHDYCAAPTVSRDGTWQTVGPSYSALLGEAKTPASCKFCSAPCECPRHTDPEAPCVGDRGQ